VVDARPSTSSESGAVNEMTAVAAVDWPTKERMSRRSSASEADACCGKRWNAAQPATLIAVVAITCATTIAAIVALSPCDAKTAIAVKRRAIETKRKNARMSYRPRSTIATPPTFSVHCASGMKAPIRIGVVNPSWWRSVSANGAMASSSTVASAPPASLNATALSNRRRSLPQSSRVV